jgi:predicted NAD-dependent protein-ADP-ribosyltransferase YbiA (DUF1768 family)
MKYTMNWLLEEYDQSARLNYIFFWGHQPLLTCQSPAEAKKLGRFVRNFDPAVWGAECVAIVVAANASINFRNTQT